MRILITGAAGYIGSALAQKLSNNQLVLVDNHSAAHDNRPRLEKINDNSIIGASICFDDVCSDITRNTEVVFHLAACSGINNCRNAEAVEDNIIGLAKLAKWCDINQVKKIIFASTSAVYGEGQSYNISETHKIHPRSRYGYQKYVGENILQSLGIPCVILRKSNVYGHGLFHKQTAVDNFIDKAFSGEPITIHGGGQQRRDYVHLDDVVNAYIQAIYWDSGIYNIGGNDNLSVDELAQIVIDNAKDILGIAIKKNYKKTDTGRTLKRFRYDYSKAMDAGFRPKGCVIEEIQRRFREKS